MFKNSVVSNLRIEMTRGASCGLYNTTFAAIVWVFFYPVCKNKTSMRPATSHTDYCSLTSCLLILESPSQPERSPLRSITLLDCTYAKLPCKKGSKNTCENTRNPPEKQYVMLLLMHWALSVE